MENYTQTKVEERLQFLRSYLKMEINYNLMFHIILNWIAITQFIISSKLDRVTQSTQIMSKPYRIESDRSKLNEEKKNRDKKKVATEQLPWNGKQRTCFNTLWISQNIAFLLQRHPFDSHSDCEFISLFLFSEPAANFSSHLNLNQSIFCCCCCCHFYWMPHYQKEALRQLGELIENHS